MKVTILLLIVSVVCGQDDPWETLKKYRWISDKESTVNWIKTKRQRAANEKLFDLFGKITIEYSDSFGVVSGDKRPIKMIGKTGSEVAIITYDSLTKKDVIVTISLDDDARGYWVYNSTVDIKEHFTRVE